MPVLTRRKHRCVSLLLYLYLILFLNSNHFCLTSYSVQGLRWARNASCGDEDEFSDLIQPVYHKINWFSFSLGPEQCCEFQTKQYLTYGQSRGLSPQQYFKKITRLQMTPEKKVNWIKAYFNQHLCLNLIESIGFGVGMFRLTGNFSQDVGFMFPFTYGRQFIVYQRSIIEKNLKYDWFLEQYVCKEQSWACTGNELDKV
ncbi:uncharacterized protein LOC142345425 [Convolutriloba macropyga]|uniref:uncharacterized protein LOC142345425 n=1 Tax=Convolutriloba macropyga TaxID=536237 RepID=UPI003F52372C